jgi:hypothetical protein
MLEARKLMSWPKPFGIRISIYVHTHRSSRGTHDVYNGSKTLQDIHAKMSMRVSEMLHNDRPRMEGHLFLFNLYTRHDKLSH